MAEVATERIDIKHFRSPGTVIARFVARRSVRSAALWGLVFGAYTASKAIGYIKAYPNPAEQLKAAAAFMNNIGIKILLGSAQHVDKVTGYVAWNVVSIIVIMGSIWGFLLATKTIRGDEDAGRWELLLTGPTTSRRAAVNVLAGLGFSLLVLYIVMSGLFILVGRYPGLNFGVSASLYLGLVIVAGIALFIRLGTFASQLMPTRAKAAGLCAAVLGLSFFIRAIADTTSASWLEYFTPLGWIERARALDGSNWIWLIPLIVSSIILGILTVVLAGRRDLGESLFHEKSEIKPRYAMLNSPLAMAARLTRGNLLAWLAGIAASALLYGFLTKSAVQAFKSAKFGNALNKIGHTSDVSVAMAFLGIVFLLQMLIIMFYAASNTTAIRKDEAEGYVDNLLVRPVSRLQWLGGRVVLSLAGIALAGLVSSLSVWVGTASQHVGISYGTFFSASVNAMAPVVLTLGVGILVFGFRPRLATVAAYGVLVWSFLISILGSGINLNHWILDTSILAQIKLAPAASPDWHITEIITALGLGLILLGMLRFRSRDLVNE